MNPRKGYRILLWVLGIGLALLLVGPFLVPVKPMEGTVPRRQLADADSLFEGINQVEVHYKVLGQGEPVFVLMHGFAASLYSWDGVMEAFSQYGRVVAYDRTGFGLSERPLNWEGENPYSAEAQIDLLVGLLDQLGVEKAILVGNSAGGTIAMQTALAHPERVSALILVDPAVYNGGGGPQWLKPLLRTPQMRHLGPLIARRILQEGESLINQAWHNPALLSDEMRENYLKPTRVENWDRALWEFTLASKPSGLVERLDESTLQVLVITGDDDRIVPTEDSIRLAGALPNASLVVIENAGHVPHEEKPEMFMQAVDQFLRQIQP